MTLRPCTVCGEPTAKPRCPEHAHSKPGSTARGYDASWKRLSKRARRLQPFCLDCGSSEDLQADHSPEAWERKERGLPIRLQDISVRCGECNRKAGAARGDAVTRGDDPSARHGDPPGRQSLRYTPPGVPT